MSVSSISSSLSSILSSYYTAGTSAVDETSETVDETSETTEDSTESSGALSQEEFTAITFSLSQGLVDTLSAASGIAGYDDSAGLSGLYSTIALQQSSTSLADLLEAYYSATSTSDEASATTDSSIDTTV